MSVVKPLGILAALAALGGLTPAAAAAQSAAAPTFTKDVAPIFQDKCEACHRPDSIAPMSLVTFEEARPWARSIKSRVVDPPDAAVAHRQDHRHPGLQERSVAQRQGDRHHRASGSTPARRRATRRTCRRAKEWPSEQGWNFAKQFGQTEPDLIVKSTPWTQKAGANDAWWKPVVETGLTEPRWVRAIEIRPGIGEGPQDHASRHRAAAAEGNRRRSRPTRTTPTATRCRARSWSGRSASRAR